MALVCGMRVLCDVSSILPFSDLGVPLMMDIIRLLSPSHIVRLVPNTHRRSYFPQTDLLPFTPHTLTSTPGILTLSHHTPHRVRVDWAADTMQSVPEHSSREYNLTHRVFSACLSAYLCVYLSVCLSVCLPLCVSYQLDL